MRNQPHPTFGFTTRGNGLARELINDISISELHDPTSGSPEPVKKTYKAIWDTGATNTAITRKVVQELGLQASGRATCHVVGAADKAATHDTDTFLVDIYLPNNVKITGLRVSEMSIRGGDVLLGMDIIANGDFAVSNYDGKTWWTFRIPSNEPIDFVEEIRQHNEHLRTNKAVAGNAEFRNWLEKDRKKQGMRRKKGK